MKNQNLPRWIQSYPTGFKDPIRKRTASNGAWLFNSALANRLMGRRRFYKRRSRGMTKQEQFQWIVVGVIFVIGFIIYFIYGFFTNCIFEWPPRWDVGTCWNEQKEPAKQKAIEDAIQFAP